VQESTTLDEFKCCSVVPSSAYGVPAEMSVYSSVLFQCRDNLLGLDNLSDLFSFPVPSPSDQFGEQTKLTSRASAIQGDVGDSGLSRQGGKSEVSDNHPMANPSLHPTSAQCNHLMQTRCEYHPVRKRLTKPAQYAPATAHPTIVPLLHPTATVLSLGRAAMRVPSSGNVTERTKSVSPLTHECK